MPNGKNKNIFDKTSFLGANSSQFIEELYADYILNPKKIPTEWKISITLDHNFSITAMAVNNNSWMDTRFAYWEGPIIISDDLTGVGYLEMTGY